MNAAAASRIVPLDAVETVAARAESEFFNIVAAVADLPADLLRVVPDGFEALLPLAGPPIMIAVAIILTFALARLLVRWQRRKMNAAGTLAGLFRLAGLEFAALAAAAL